jgi:hypothetical protein
LYHYGVAAAAVVVVVVVAGLGANNPGADEGNDANVANCIRYYNTCLTSQCYS